MELLLNLLILLIIARVFGAGAEWLGQAPVMGQLLAGGVLGILVSVFGTDIGLPFAFGETAAIDAVAELGLFFLMLFVGIEVAPDRVLRNSRVAFSAAIGGAVVPLLLGIWLAATVLPDGPFRLSQILFVGIAISTTAVPVTLAVLHDMRLVHHRIGMTVTTAAVADDVLGLLLLAVLTAVIGTGNGPAASDVLLLASKVLAFFVITAGLGRFVLPYVETHMPAVRMSEIAFERLLVFALAFGVLAELLGMHFLLGPFMAGALFQPATVGESRYRSVLESTKAITLGFLAPIFFMRLGLRLDLSALWAVPGFLAALIVIAFLGKLVGAGLPAWLAGFDRRDALGVGVAMSGRGVVGLVVCDIALEAGIFAGVPEDSVTAHLFSAVVLTVFATTVAMPILLRRVVNGPRPPVRR